jgi:plasmid stabilization system protein ParE
VSWRVIVRPEAETDLRETQVWYDSRRPGLGDEFLTEVERAVLLLAEKPDNRPAYYNGFRLFITRRFPYKLFYRLEKNCIVVFRILHVTRDHRRHL